MRNSDGSRKTRTFIVICIGVLALVSVPLASGARTVATSAYVATSVNIVNNSSRAIRNVYSSHVDSDDWSADLLGDGSIAAGQSGNVGNIACDSQQVKIIAEDEDGCFLSTVVTCGQSSSWTVNNDTTRDCGY